MAVASRARAPGLRSRYAASGAAAPDPGADPTGFARVVEAIVERDAVEIVYPATEEAIDALRGTSVERRLPYPRPAALEALRDKRMLPTRAWDVGLTWPETLASGLPAEVAAARIEGPVIVNSALGVGPLPFTTFAPDRAALEVLLATLPADEPVLVQRRHEGLLVGLALVIDDGGRVVARFQQRADRTWPLGGGVSTSAVSVPPDEGLIDCARALLESAGYAGLAHLQFLVDDERAVLIDVNPRFYGSLPLALAAGVNLPAIWHAVVTGKEPPPMPPYRLGVRFRWLEGNLLAATRGEPRALLDAGLRRRTGAIWARDDPQASAAFGIAAVEERIRKRLRRT